MTTFWKTAAGLLITTVLALQIGKKEPDLGMLLRMAACAMAAMTVLYYLQPVLEFLHNLETVGDLRGDMLLILLKATGIGLTTEIVAAVCCDAGSPSLGKVLTILGTAVIIYISLPVFTALLEMIQEITGEL